MLSFKLVAISLLYPGLSSQCVLTDCNEHSDKIAFTGQSENIHILAGMFPSNNLYVAGKKTYAAGRRKIFVQGVGGRFKCDFFKQVLLALISPLTIYIGN